MFEQDRLLVRLQQRVQGEKAIQVCLLTGSYGRGVHDKYSDLDVVLIFDSEANRAAAYEERQAFVRSVLPYVPAKSFDAEHIRPFLHIALYANGAKVDYCFEFMSSMTPNPWHRDARVLKDTDGWGEQYIRDSKDTPTTYPRPTITAAELGWLDQRFWVMFMDVYRLLMRGDYDKPFPVYLELLYFTIPRLRELLPPEDQAYQDLIQLYFSRDTRSTLDHLRELLFAYLQARESIVRRHGLLFAPDEVFERELLKRIRKP